PTAYGQRPTKKPARGPAGIVSESDLQITVDETLKLILRHHADRAVDEFAVFEHHQGRDRSHAELLRHLGVVVDVHLGDDRLPRVIRRELFHHRTDHPAGAAPGRPEVDERRLAAFEHHLLEVLICYNFDSV